MGEEGLVAGDSDVWKGGEAHEVVVVDDTARKVLEKDALFFLVNIEAEVADLSGFNGTNGIAGVKKGSAAGIDNHHASFHFFNGLPADEVLGLGEERAVQADDVAAGEKFVEADVATAEVGDGAILLDVVGEDPASKASHDSGEAGSDGSGSDDANRFSVDVESLESIQREIVFPNAVVGAGVFSIEFEDEAHGMFRHGIGGVGRDAGDFDSVLEAGFEVDVVIARAAKGDPADPFIGKNFNDPGVEFIMHEAAHGIVAVCQQSRFPRQSHFDKIEVNFGLPGEGIAEKLPVVLFRAEYGYVHCKGRNGKNVFIQLLCRDRLNRRRNFVEG